jgi:hypothetical protein
MDARGLAGALEKRPVWSRATVVRDREAGEVVAEVLREPVLLAEHELTDPRMQPIEPTTKAKLRGRPRSKMTSKRSSRRTSPVTESPKPIRPARYPPATALAVAAAGRRELEGAGVVVEPSSRSRTQAPFAPNSTAGWTTWSGVPSCLGGTAGLEAVISRPVMKHRGGPAGRPRPTAS